MSTLDEKILDGPNVGYCSDSSDEGEAAFTSSANDEQHNDTYEKQSSTGPRTGPKGVLSDYERYKRELQAEERASGEKLLRIANRLSLSGKHPTDGKEEDVDELEQIRLRRLAQLRNAARGRVMEIPDRFQFLATLENHSNALIFVHIYSDASADASSPLNDALLELSALDCDDGGGGKIRFFKVKSTILGTSEKFTRDALPTLQIYKEEILLGSFVRITDDLGEDFDAKDLITFLKRNGISLDLEKGQ